jgi:formylglycine-generating enzyme required for sulfatase activity
LTVEELLKEARVRENSAAEEYPDGRPDLVGKRAANPWGLHDMLGNVAEWVRPEKAGDVPAVRGGSFRSSAKVVKYSYRQPYSPNWQIRDLEDPKSRWWMTDAEFVGFRIVRDRE